MPTITPEKGRRPAPPRAGLPEQCRTSNTTPTDAVHAVDILVWLRSVEDVIDAIRDGAIIRPESVLVLVAAEQSLDRAKSLATGLAAQRLAMPADVDVAFRAWPELVGA